MAYASDLEFCRHLCDSFEEFFVVEMFVACTSYFVRFLVSASQIVSDTLTKTDSCHFFFFFFLHSIMVFWAIAKLTTVKHKIGNSTGKCNRNFENIYSFISILILTFLYVHNANCKHN